MKLTRAEQGAEVGRLMLLDDSCRAEQEDGARRIGGVAAPYDSWTVLYDSGSYRHLEQYARNCFAGSMDADVRSMFNHDPNFILGRTRAKTMRLKDTDRGLTYEVDVDGEDPMALGVYARVKRGDVTGASCWFRVSKVDSTEQRLDDGTVEVRDIIQEAELRECGPVTMPAYEDATATVRGIMDVIKRREREAAQRSYDDFIAAIEAAGS